jgi:hypothetical protein
VVCLRSSRIVYVCNVGIHLVEKTSFWLIPIATVFQPWSQPASPLLALCLRASVYRVYIVRLSRERSDDDVVIIRLRIPAARLSFERLETRRSGVSRLLSHLQNIFCSNKRERTHTPKPNVTLYSTRAENYQRRKTNLNFQCPVSCVSSSALIDINTAC